jgi:hypothetical protein
VPSPREMTTTCRFPRSCAGKPTDAGLEQVFHASLEGPHGPSFFRSTMI